MDDDDDDKYNDRAEYLGAMPAVAVVVAAADNESIGRLVGQNHDGDGDADDEVVMTGEQY